MDACDHDQPLTPELDAAVARTALAEGDLAHAAHHIAGALANDPHRPDLLALVDALVDRAGGASAARAAVPVDGASVWYGAVALHALLAARAGDVDRALDLLCQVAVLRPEVPYLGWAQAWTAGLDPAAAASAFGRLLAIDAAPGTPAVNGAITPALALLAGLREAHPDVAVLWPIASMLSRRAGKPDDAHALARTAFERFPSWNAAVALANACKALNRWADAEAAWGAALAFDPDDLSVRLDWADSLLDRRELDAARAKYQEVLDREPAHPWAIASTLFVDWARNPTAVGRLVLSGYADTRPDDARARFLADQATPFVGRLPGPTEATIRSLSELARKPGQLAGKTTLSLTHLESPSSQRAAHRLAAEHGGKIRFQVSEVPRPDPREPFASPTGPVRWTLWTWSGTDARPALPEPTNPRARHVLGKLANTRYASDQWLGRAGALATQHGLDVREASHVEEVLGAALHPGDGPSWATPWDWAYRLAFAAGFALASGPGWPGTAHRDGLWSMVGVRNDWLAVGAVTALCERARVDPVVRADAQPRLIDLLRDGPLSGHWCVGWALTSGLLRIGQTEDEELRHALANHLRGFEDPAPAG